MNENHRGATKEEMPKWQQIGRGASVRGEEEGYTGSSDADGSRGCCGSVASAHSVFFHTLLKTALFFLWEVSIFELRGNQFMPSLVSATLYEKGRIDPWALTWWCTTLMLHLRLSILMAYCFLLSWDILNMLCRLHSKYQQYAYFCLLKEEFTSVNHKRAMWVLRINHSLW